MSDISLRRCRNHVQREAAALCPECSAFYCRECIAEHEGRILCASCLANFLGRASDRSRFPRIITLGRVLAGALLLWFFFYGIGLALHSLPVSVHEGTLWEGWWVNE